MHSVGRSPSLIVVLLAIQLWQPAFASDQANPYKFPVARGDKLPITEGFWASPPSACRDLENYKGIRPHVGFKGFGFPDKSEDVEFAYLGPRLSNWPDGACFVLMIERTGSTDHFRFNGVCGDVEQGVRLNTDLFHGSADVKSHSSIVLTRRDKYETRVKTFALWGEVNQ